MTTLFSLKDIPLPKNWTNNVKLGVLHVISPAYSAMTYTRGWAANSRNSRIRLAAEVDRLENEVALLKETMGIKDARMMKIAPHRRPYYRAPERLAILEVKAARGWSHAETARQFLVKPSTIASWMARADAAEPSSLVQTRTPINRFPDFVRYMVQRLKALCPAMGKKRIAQILSRAGLHLAVTTVATMLKEKLRSRPANAGKDESTEIAELTPRAAPGRTVTAKHPGNVWQVDMTAVPISAGFWAAWFPFTMPQAWPFCWWVAVALDHYSRRIMGFAIFKTTPTFLQIRSFLGRTMGRVKATPKYFVTDKGPQFWCPGFKTWCKSRGIRPRFGAVGQHGSIAVVERLVKSLKDEFLRRILVPLSLETTRRQLSWYALWYNEHRPHQSLGGRTPREVYEAQSPANEKPRFEPRERWPQNSLCASPQARTKGKAGVRLELEVTFHEGHRELPIVTLKRAA